MRSLARRANSEDSIEVISTSDSVFPDDLLIFTAITEEEPEEHGIMGSVIQEEEEEEAAGEDTPIQQHGTLGIIVHEEEEEHTWHQRIMGNVVQTEGEEELEDTPTRPHSTLGIEVQELEEEEEKQERCDTPVPMSEPQGTLGKTVCLSSLIIIIIIMTYPRCFQCIYLISSLLLTDIVSVSSPPGASRGLLQAVRGSPCQRRGHRSGWA